MKTSRFTSQNLQDVFTFPFRDPKWPSKLAIAALLFVASIFIIPSFFLSGYFYEIMRRIIVDKDDPGLPDWEDMGTYFTNGLKLFGVGILYSLPILLLALLSFLLLPFFIMLSESGVEGASFLFLLAMPVSMVTNLLITVLSVALTVLMITGVGHMIAQGEFGAAFRIREWWPILRSNLGGYLLTYLILIGASWLVVMMSQFLMLTVVLCAVIPLIWIVQYAYFGAISSALFAQAYVDGVEKSRPRGE